MTDPFVYEVRLDANESRPARVLTVDLDFETYVMLSGRQFTQEWVIIQSIQVLLDRREELPDRLDLGDWAREPTFAAEVDARLHRR